MCFGIKSRLLFSACELPTLHWQLKLGDSVLCGHSQSENSNVCGTQVAVAAPNLLSKSVFTTTTALFLSLVQHPEQPA